MCRYVAGRGGRRKRREGWREGGRDRHTYIQTDRDRHTEREKENTQTPHTQRERERREVLTDTTKGLNCFVPIV